MPARYRVMKLILLAAAHIPVLAGCLSLGGRTTNVHDNPKTNARLSGLEIRVNALEQALRTTSVEIPVPVDSYNSPGATTPAAP